MLNFKKKKRYAQSISINIKKRDIHQVKLKRMEWRIVDIDILLNGEYKGEKPESCFPSHSIIHAYKIKINSRSKFLVYSKCEFESLFTYKNACL